MVPEKVPVPEGTVLESLATNEIIEAAKTKFDFKICSFLSKSASTNVSQVWFYSVVIV